MSTSKGLTARDRDTAIFVGGIVGSATEKDLRDYFEQFGAIYSITLIPKKGNRRLNSGYCFISFKESHTKWIVLAVEKHYIYGRRVNCKSLLKGADLKEERSKNSSKKLCVKFLPVGTTERQFENFFSTFGEIHSFYLVTYRNSQNPTCNGYVVFKREEVFRKLLDMKYVQYGADRLRIQRYVKQNSKEHLSGTQEEPSLLASIECGPLSAIRPTQVSYHKQGGHSRATHESNIRFNILLDPMTLPLSNRDQMVSGVKKDGVLTMTSIILKHD